LCDFFSLIYCYILAENNHVIAIDVTFYTTNNKQSGLINGLINVHSNHKRSLLCPEEIPITKD